MQELLHTDEMKKDQLIESLEDEGLGAMGARARAILTMREKDNNS